MYEWPWLNNATIGIEGLDNRRVSLLMHGVSINVVYRLVGWFSSPRFQMCTWRVTGAELRWWFRLQMMPVNLDILLVQ